jgi:hemoglobin-like flavoprotein
MHQHLQHMTLDQKQLVQKTWEKVLPISDYAATLFYRRLFEMEPSTRPLFTHTNMPDQREKLMHVIGMAVNGLDMLDKLIPAVSIRVNSHKVAPFFGRNQVPVV